MDSTENYKALSNVNKLKNVSPKKLHKAYKVACEAGVQ